MAACFEKSCLIGLPCVYFVDVYHFVCAYFPFRFKDGMWNCVVLIHAYFSLKSIDG